MNKYRNVKTTVDNIVFASKDEAKRYGELKLMARIGAIIELKLQQPYFLGVWTDLTADYKILGKYIADFDYMLKQPDGNYKRVTEDVKGVRTALYGWKKKHFEAQYGWPITEYPPKKPKKRKLRDSGAR